MQTYETLPESCSMPEYIKSTTSLLIKKIIKTWPGAKYKCSVYANENETSSYTWYSLCTTLSLSSIWGGAICENS